MNVSTLPPPWDKIASQRKGVLYVPAAEIDAPRRNGRPRTPIDVRTLPLPTEERGHRTLALLLAALALQPTD